MSFSAVAATRCVVFQIDYNDLKMIPLSVRKLLSLAANHRL